MSYLYHLKRRLREFFSPGELHLLFPSGWELRKSTVVPREKYVWKRGCERLIIEYRHGAGDHEGYLVSVTSSDENARLQLSNGFARSFRRAMILADMYACDEERVPAAFMYTNRMSSDLGMGDTVRQDEWLDAHENDYQFEELSLGVKTD
jgi:hypothetical protein